MSQLTHIPCCAHILNLIGYLTHLKIHEISSPYKILLYTEPIGILEAINFCLQNKRELNVITIYLNFISIYAKEFVQDLDFFQQSKKSIFPFVKSWLQQFTSYIEANKNTNNFGPLLYLEIFYIREDLIKDLKFNPEEFYLIFQEAFEVAYEKFKLHIPNYPAHSLFYASQRYHTKDIRRYNIIKEFDNPSDEWGIYCGLDNEIINEIELDQYWLSKETQLPILYKIAFDYIWLPVSSCSVERSFSMYNSLLDSDRQNLSLDSLKRLNILLQEWGIYCGLDNEIINEIELDQYWLSKETQLPILYKIAFDYIWLPVSSCSVERSFSMYNSLLDSDRQNLSLDSLKRLNMLYFNGF
ncbi:hypothetical protein Glove_103g129 [Diversispora epigaea]|uniref:HAT C-terminal dimerisation domain-containing protein n=1 Tax=Diversispora epigaea TaxID=1348612 RepID=A0A397J3F0_9GLOM|nr:hypothetical protein Glove_103g129 [Diversispora epigaea]